jgi:hypothetical protein
MLAEKIFYTRQISLVTCIMEILNLNTSWKLSVLIENFLSVLWSEFQDDTVATWLKFFLHISPYLSYIILQFLF